VDPLQNITIYVINMKRNPERAAHAHEQMRKIGLKRHEYIMHEAWDAKTEVSFFV
jgi:GR25 family glycosyltransferase involved in LPS biosynthesis